MDLKKTRFFKSLIFSTFINDGAQGGRNAFFLGEAPNIFYEKRQIFFLIFYCLKRFHGLKLGEAHASASPVPPSLMVRNHLV